MVWLINLMRIVWRAVRRSWNFVIAALQLFIRYVVIGILYIVGLYYTQALFAKMSADTTTITNSAFAIFGSLAALSFAWSRSLDAESDHKKRISHAGERFLHAALCVLSASILKYAALAAGVGVANAGSGFGVMVLQIAAGVTVGGLFFAALTFSHSGLVVLNRFLWQRANDYPEYDSFA